MVTRITSSNIEPGSITTDRLASGVSGGPKIINVVVADSSYNVLDDTAISTSGGYVRITGSGFNSGCSVLVGNSVATSTSFVSSNFLNAQLPALPAGTYPMYVVNPDGATAIRVNAITYSLTPTWITGSTLPSQSVNNSFSVQLNATSNSSVVYSVASGSSLPAGVTLSSAGLLSGIITDITEPTVYSFIIEAIDAENQESPRSFTVNVSVGDIFFNSTSLLVNGDNETFITDASVNASTITPNGDTRPSAFSPYNTSWSNYFDGTGDYLTIADSADFDLSGDYTIDLWFYPAVAGGLQRLFMIGDYRATYNGLDFYTNASNQIVLYVNGASIITSTATATPFQWNHVALTRSGGGSNNTNLYLNGTLIEQVTDTTSFTGVAGNGVSIGLEYSGVATAVTSAMYISNVRLVNGTAIAPPSGGPTSPLTAISGTSLLTCQSNRLIDNSTNNFTITKNGDVKVTAFGPFIETDTATGSVYFDGSGDFIEMSKTLSDLYIVGSKPDGESQFVWTWEAWVYPTATDFTIMQGASNASGQLEWYYYHNSSTGLSLHYRNYGSSDRFVYSDRFCPVGQWSHIVAQKSDNSDWIFYVNGVKATIRYGSGGSPNAYGDVGLVNSSSTKWGTGGTFYMNDFRFIKNDRYTESTITVPTTPLTADAETSFLSFQNRIGYNNSQPIDESGISNVITRNGNASVGSFSPHVPTGWSVHLATDRSVSFTGNASTTLDGDFTFETWVYLTSYVGGGLNELMILTNRSDNSVGTNIDIGNSNAASPGIFGLWYNGSSIFVTTGAGDVPLNAWTHLAITREGTGTNNVKAFINGVLKAQATSTATFFGTNTMYIGDSMYNQQFNNYVSNMRVIKGRALYTTSASLDSAVFNPPTYSLSPTDDTSFLLFRDGNYVTDSGPQRLTITPGASAPIAVAFSPFKPHTVAPLSHSVYFDGNGDELSLSNSASFEMGNGDFTYEAWVYALKQTNTYAQSIISYGIAGNLGSSTISFDISNNGYLSLAYATGSSFTIQDTTLFPINEWVHCVACRTGSTISLFVNGSRVITTTTSATVGTGGIQKVGGQWYENAATRQLQGYISNARIIKGSGPYDATQTTLTVPTSPLTAISGTSLLTCQSPTVIDNSTNEFAITVNGNSQPTKFNPFGETVTTGVEYSPVSHGGSIYNDGASDSIKIPHSEEQTLRDGDFTIEFWFYPTATLGSGACLLTKGWGSYAPYLFYVSGANIVFYASANGSSWNVSNAQIIGAYQVNAWNHITVTRNGTSFRGFMNGAAGFSFISSATLLVNTTTVTLGAADNNSSAGPVYYHGLRILKGAALYTSAFVPPAAPVTPIPSTTLLINGTNAAIQDKTGRNVLETVGNARVVNGVRKYGSGAMSFDGTGDTLQIPASVNALPINGNNFTIEFWYRFAVVPGTQYFYVQRFDGNNYIFIYATSTGWVFDTFSSGAQGPKITSSTITPDAVNWHHFALVYLNGVYTMYVDGISVGTQTNSTVLTTLNGYIPTIPVYIASRANIDSYVNGYIDDLRITKGVARYENNFDPPGLHLAR